MPRGIYQRKTKKRGRPYATHYFYNPVDSTADTVSHGASASEEGALRACIVRVFLGQYAKAVIHDRSTGVPVYTVRRGAGGIRVSYGSGVDFKTWDDKKKRAA